LGQLQALEHLDLTFNTLTRTPAVLGQLTDLRFLSLRGNQDTYGSDETPLVIDAEVMGRLSKLETLEMGFNWLTLPPDGPGVLPKLKDLRIDATNAGVPGWLEHVPTLESLNLDDVEVQGQLEHLAPLNNLRRLILTRNSLERLPDVLRRLPRLDDLRMYGNRLADVPAWIGELQALRTLDLSCNDLRTLPPALGALAALERLNLFGNRLSSLPAWLGRLKGLRTLDVHSNPLHSLPESLAELPNLEDLCIKDLLIDEFPTWLTHRLPLISPCDMFLVSHASE
jgi:Leucine-rich repeat (LRR) protein